MRRIALFSFVCLLGSTCIGGAQESPQGPQNLEQAKAALSRVLTARKIAAELSLKYDLLFLKCNTGKFMVPMPSKVKLDPTRLQEEEGPRETGILMRIGLEEGPAIHQAEQIRRRTIPGDLLAPPHQAVSLFPGNLIEGEPPHQAEDQVPGDMQEGATSSLPASQQTSRTPWETVMLHAPVNGGKSYLHISVSYGRAADRSLLRELLESLGVVLPRRAPTPDLPRKEVKPYVVITGANSHITERQYFLVRSKDEWTALWLRHLGKEPPKEYNHYLNPDGVPRVNFEDCMVIAIFQGQGFNSAGLEAVSMHEDSESLLFRFRELTYQTMEPGDHVTVYGFFVLARSTKTVVLEEDCRRLKDEPPVWRERVRFGKLASEKPR